MITIFILNKMRQAVRIVPVILSLWGVFLFLVGVPPVDADSGSHAETEAKEEREVVVYSARMEQLIKPVFDAYTKKTGVNVKFITGQEGPLLQRILAEGEETPADLFLTVDAGMLWKAADEKIFKPVTSPLLTANIPSHLRDPENRWFGLSLRARTLVYHTKKVRPGDLTTYEALGDPKWKGRLCLRTSKKIYNQSLVAMMIAEWGTEKAEKIIRSWVANLATDVFPDDTEVMQAIAKGLCDVGIVNSYYYGRLMEKSPELPLALFWPNQNGSGVHVNISGGGVVRHANHEKEAIRLLEWLSSEEAQNLFADVNLEYPANPNIKPHPRVAAWGTFKENKLNVSMAGKLQVDAIKLMDRVGYK